jgi:hypothetical protein
MGRPSSISGETRIQVGSRRARPRAFETVLA